MEKIINHFRLTVSASLNYIEIPIGKTLPHKEKIILGKKCVFKYRAEVVMLSYLQVLKKPEISMAIHRCEYFCNNPRLVHERAIISIANYLSIMPT